MNCFSYAIDLNIKRYQNLLDASADETERRTIQALLAEEKTKAALRASEPTKDKLNCAAAHLSRSKALQDIGGGHNG
jgi:hypothetical protein